MNSKTAFLTLVLLHLCASVCRAQQPDSPINTQQTVSNCRLHPETPACQKTAHLPAGTETPSLAAAPTTGAATASRVEESSAGKGPIAPLPEPSAPPTEFQLMVADSVGEMLPIYGGSLFRQAPSTFAPLENVPVPADYVIGPGDELNIWLWGTISAELRVTVDRNGQVFIPKVGAITAAGVRVSNLDAHFRSQIERIYKNFDLSVTLGKLRSIDIFFVGQARRPGSYTVSSLSTLVNAIFAAGGPAPQGSMRHIQLKRDGRVVTEFDLYDLLLKGDTSSDAPLLPGDVIYVPSAGPQVAVTGSVNAPAIYELKDQQTSLATVIELAGGLNTVADGSKSTIERIDERRVRSVCEFPLDANGLQQMVKDGDIVRLMSIVPRFENAVTLRGNVANAGRYPWHAGMRVRDLIPNKEALLTRNYWQSQNALVFGDMTRYQKYQAKGEPDRSEVKLNAPEINWEYAVIQRLNQVDLTTTLIPFSLSKAVLERDDADNLELRAGDIVTVFSQRDIAVPTLRQTKFVRVEGEVRVPGIYRIQEGETLRALLQRAGGFTDNAYVYGTQFTRESARLEQQASLNRIAGELETEIAQKNIANVRSNPESAEAMGARADAQRSLLQLFRQTKATGRVVLQLKPGDTTVAAVPSVVLEDLDRVLVPPHSEVVSVVGSVFNQSSFLYRKNARVGDYIRASGRGNATADLKHALLVRADGSVISHTSLFHHFGESFESIRVLPGDTIVIPAKLQSGGFSQALREWLTLASQASIAAAVISLH